MTVATLRHGLAAAAADTEAQLAGTAPHLVDGYRAALPRAADTVGRRLRGALYREGILAGPAGRYRRHGFNRIEFAHAGTADPSTLLPPHTEALAVEITNAVVNLAIAYARRSTIEAGMQAPDMLTALAGTPPDEHALALERLATDGHNLHPCGRTRLGWRVPDLLAHDLEAGRTRIALVPVPRDRLVGDDVGAALAEAHPDLPAPPPGHVLQPVHAWQLGAVVRRRYADVLGDAVALASLPAQPTAAVRTLLLDNGRYLKVSLDIQVTSTRRTISVASTQNGPAISRLLGRLLDEEERVILLTEVAGAAVPAGPGRDRDVAAIVRTGLAGRLAPGEVPVPGGALPARSPVSGRTVLAELVDRYGGSALDFLDEYARLLLPPVLRLASRYGIGLEAHLQNCIPTFVDGAPHRLALRDFAGLRLHRPRLAAAGVNLPLWPGSVVGTDDETVMLSKVGYTALQAHLGELVVLLTDSHGLDEAAAWRRIRAIVDDAVAGPDHTFFTAPQMPHKALVRMRLVGSGDVYVPVENPLHAP
jgi:D-ornithine---citrate ligase